MRGIVADAGSGHHDDGDAVEAYQEGHLHRGVHHDGVGAGVAEPLAEAGHPGLIAALSALGLIDPDAEAERRRNILVTPFADAATLALAAAVQGALAQMPALPAKFGFAVDTGPAPVLSAVAADIRLERAADGRLLVRCDGAALGAPVEDAAAAVVALCLLYTSDAADE